MPRPMRRARCAASVQLRHRGHIRIRLHDIIEEARREHHTLAQQLPIHCAIGSAVLVEVDGTETAVLVWAKPLLAAIMNNQSIRNKRMCIGLMQIINSFNTIRLYSQNSCKERLYIRPAYHAAKIICKSCFAWLRSRKPISFAKRI